MSGERPTVVDQASGAIRELAVGIGPPLVVSVVFGLLGSVFVRGSKGGILVVLVASSVLFFALFHARLARLAHAEPGGGR